MFELFALDAPIDVPAVGASPAQTRAAVLAAMAGHVRGKGVYTGTFKTAVRFAGLHSRRPTFSRAASPHPPSGVNCLHPGYLEE